MGGQGGVLGWGGRVGCVPPCMRHSMQQPRRWVVLGGGRWGAGKGVILGCLLSFLSVRVDWRERSTCCETVGHTARGDKHTCPHLPSPAPAGFCLAGCGPAL